VIPLRGLFLLFGRFGANRENPLLEIKRDLLSLEAGHIGSNDKGGLGFNHVQRQRSGRGIQSSKHFTEERIAEDMRQRSGCGSIRAAARRGFTRTTTECDVHEYLLFKLGRPGPTPDDDCGKTMATRVPKSSDPELRFCGAPQGPGRTRFAGNGCRFATLAEFAILPVWQPVYHPLMANQFIDLRSDTVTRPTPEMRKAIANAEVGDEVLGDDPTVRKLEEKFAAHLGKPAACFVPTGTMANQTAIRAHTEPGDEIICSDGAHIIHYETGAPAALSGCMVRTIAHPRGLFDVADVTPMVRQDAYHFPHSRLLTVENTHNRGGGTVWPLAQIERVTAEARKHRLRLHLDGARLWNASIASGVAMKEYAKHFDTISCCFSKGLGAPIGSAVAGDVENILRVQRFKKMFGGMTRQVGILAAAALYAMDNHVQRLAEDHANAKRLSELVGNIPGLSIALAPVETNIVYFDIAKDVPVDAQQLSDKLKNQNVLMLATGPRRIRCVTHLDVNSPMIDQAAQAIEHCVTGRVTGRVPVGV